ncbi:DUF5939 domain-containing protein [Rhizobium leguminosarum]|uniref:DUF5939 domain-containing protein n=1 Tax=Rhizobium leguminosarum TaxID=384 RepID=UPI002F9377E4
MQYGTIMFDRQAALMILRDRVDPTIADVIADLIENGRDAQLNRANPIGLARKRNLDETLAIDGFVHATRLGLFELSWNVVCPGCGGVLLAAEHLSHLERERYTCALCAVDCQPGLDESVEVTFTVSPAVREGRLPSHDRAMQVAPSGPVAWQTPVTCCVVEGRRRVASQA